MMQFLDEPFAGFGHLLVFLLRLQEFAWIADRDRAREGVDMLDAAEHLFNGHAQYRLVYHSQNEDAFASGSRSDQSPQALVDFTQIVPHNAKDYEIQSLRPDNGPRRPFPGESSMRCVRAALPVWHDEP